MIFHSQTGRPSDGSEASSLEASQPIGVTFKKGSGELDDLHITLRAKRAKRAIKRPQPGPSYRDLAEGGSEQRQRASEAVIPFVTWLGGTILASHPPGTTEVAPTRWGVRRCVSAQPIPDQTGVGDKTKAITDRLHGDRSIYFARLDSTRLI